MHPPTVLGGFSYCKNTMCNRSPRGLLVQHNYDCVIKIGIV